MEPLFGSLDVDYDERTVVRRVITPAGKSRAYVNDLPVQLTALREIGVRLIDIHSQHQTLLLGDSRFRTGLLDSVERPATGWGSIAGYTASSAVARASWRHFGPGPSRAAATGSMFPFS